MTEPSAAFSTTVRYCTLPASPTGITIRPPAFSWRTSAGGTWGAPAVTRIESKGARAAIPFPSYVAVLPPGAPSTSDYLPGFSKFVGWMDTRLGEDLARARAEHPIDESRIFLVGFSLGGDTSWALLARHPETYAGAVVMGSRASARPNGAARRTMVERRVRVSFGMGLSDDAVNGPAEQFAADARRGRGGGAEDGRLRRGVLPAQDAVEPAQVGGENGTLHACLPENEESGNTSTLPAACTDSFGGRSSLALARCTRHAGGCGVNIVEKSVSAGDRLAQGSGRNVPF